ncbi:MAG: AAA family ATPase [Verrucomicrobiota bacterium]
MVIKTWQPYEQIAPSVDLGAVVQPLPDMVWFDDFVAKLPTPPPLLVRGLLHKGCKMILGGTSKSNKSWCLLDLALSVASGSPWWGLATVQAPVVYVNFELQPWALQERLWALRGARPEFNKAGRNLALWNLRGKNADMKLLRPLLEAQLTKHPFGLIILDPAYKVLGNRDENANGEIADLMNEFEALAQASGAAVVVAHHFAKGDSTAKSAMDRMSGAGAWARDPDAILILTPHEEENAFTCTSILRNLPILPEFVLSWDYPLMRVAKELNPDALRRPQAKNKVCTDKEFLDAVMSDDAKGHGRIMAEAKQCLNIGRTTAARYLARLVEAGLVTTSAGVYWRAKS